MKYVTSRRGGAAAALGYPSAHEVSSMQHTRNTRATTAAPFRTPSLTRFLDAKFVQSVEPTTASSPVESSVSSTPFAPASLVGSHFPAGEHGAELMRRLYTATCNRRQRHDGEDYRFDAEDGIVNVWRTA